MANSTSDSQTPKRTRRARPSPDNLNTLAPIASDLERPTRVAPARAAGAESAAPVSEEVHPSPPAPKGFASVPDAVLDRYYRIRNEFFLDNGELAFVNDGQRLTTRSENVEIVRDLVRIAHHNGYAEVSVTGTDRFRREVWGQATRLGMEVQGYTPTEHDKKQWVRAAAREAAQGGMAHASHSPELSASVATPVLREPSATTDTLLGTAGGAAGNAAPEIATPAASDARGARTYSGELVDHGPDYFQHNPREDMSYFVKLHTAQGELELWGRDLERALVQSKTNPQTGDRIAVVQTHREPVTVKARRFDEAGQLLSEEDKTTHRNQWRIEKREFFEERAQLARVLRDTGISPQEGARRHPQLVGTYFVLKEAEHVAQQAYVNRADQDSFVRLMRERLAEEIEQGAALRTTQIRSRERAQTREQGIGGRPQDSRLQDSRLQDPREPEHVRA